MPREWMDVSQLSFNTLLLLEEVQLSWLPGWLPERELQIITDVTQPESLHRGEHGLRKRTEIFKGFSLCAKRLRLHGENRVR